MLKEFKDFAVKGNVIDLAVGVVIGGAFGKIIASLVADVITPMLGLVVGGVNFRALSLTLVEATAESPAVAIAYGSFLQQVFDFVIIAFSIFMFVKAFNSFKRKEEAAPTIPPVPT
ncbi:MAG: large-conductance mechanosensitive channel protein MscL, partial [Bdellovibrionales bacterium]|nr:large-conductance mechanosensitive channel protein MscL [Bdellovibrionales bacterium]